MRRAPGWCLVAAGVAACGGGSGKGPPPNLPSWSGRAVELFDDAIEGTAVGLDVLPSPPPATDSRLRERVQTADAVVTARVTTVTSKKEGPGHEWELALHTVSRLAGKGPLDTDFTLEIGATDQASGIIKAVENGLVGKTFVVFVRGFGNPGDAYEVDLKFHMAGPTPAEIDAVKQATLLDQVR
jgi:hypothetical protein